MPNRAMPNSHVLRRPLMMLPVAVLAAFLLAGTALAHHKPDHTGGPPSGNGPHDNRGTVKIHEGATEPAALMANQPQVCAFHVHMFKFHANQELGISIVGQGGANVAGPDTYTSTVTTDANGDARDPGTGSITLADGMYKLTVDTGRGAGKHKVFKVDCAGEEGPTAGNGPGGGPGAVPGGSGVTGPTNPPKPGELPNTATEPVDSTLALGGAVVLLAALGGFAFVARKGFAFSR